MDVITKPKGLLNNIMLIVMVLVLLGSSVLVSFSVHLCRRAVGELQALDIQRDKLDVVWSKLLLEHSTLGSLNEVENRAHQHLNMGVPEGSQMIGVKP